MYVFLPSQKQWRSHAGLKTSGWQLTTYTNVIWISFDGNYLIFCAGASLNFAPDWCTGFFFWVIAANETGSANSFQNVALPFLIAYISKKGFSSLALTLFNCVSCPRECSFRHTRFSIGFTFELHFIFFRFYFHGAIRTRIIVMANQVLLKFH